MKTATLERYAIFGTSRHMQRLTYRGKLVSWPIEGQGRACASAPCYGHETIAAMMRHAFNAGFTHVRFVGDWKRYTVRKTLRTSPKPYTFNPPTIAKILAGIGA